jgi:taurine dioxygenase
MSQKPYDLFDVSARGITIGAEIGGIDLRAPLTPDLHRELHRALLEWKVIFFRDQHLTADEHIAFARNWGSLETHPALQAGSKPELVRFEKGGEEVTPASAGYENTWHSDVSWRAEPSLGSILRCIEGPEVGGDTLWADMHAAYDQLPVTTQSKLEGLSGRHSFIAAFGQFFSPEKAREMATLYPDQLHPVIRTHPETLRKLLYVNGIFTQEIVGLSTDESEDLIGELCSYATLPELQVRWNWRPHDVAFWDNRSTQHYACSDYWPARRVMERATVIGDRPF